MGKIVKKAGHGPATKSKKNDQSETDLNSFNIATNTIEANRVEPEHTMGEEFLCDWCGLVFNSKVLQHEHILSIHQHVVIDNLEESSKCQECGLSFQTKQILQEHISSAHPDIITIPGIGKVEVMSNHQLKKQNLDNILNLESDLEQPKPKKRKKKSHGHSSMLNESPEQSENDMMKESTGQIESYIVGMNGELVPEVSEIDSSQISVNVVKSNVNAVCAVASCPSPPDLKYFWFPTDPRLKQIWSHRCSRQDPLPKFPRICERHFETLLGVTQHMLLSRLNCLYRVARTNID